jgi:hypothetical protein
MAKKNPELSRSVKQPLPPRVDGLSLGRLLEAVNLVNQKQSGPEPIPKRMSMRDTTVSTTVKNATTGIRFGSPSNSRTPTPHSSNQLSRLLQHTASGGIANVIGGGLSGIAGLGGLVSGILHLFGGGQGHTLPPLVEFRLPGSQQQTLYVGSNGNATFQGTAVEQASRPTPSGGIYTAGDEAGSSGATGQMLRYQSGQIAQAVKNALLNSSSLNDVIAEI